MQAVRFFSCSHLNFRTKYDEYFLHVFLSKWHQLSMFFSFFIILFIQYSMDTMYGLLTLFVAIFSQGISDILSSLSKVGTVPYLPCMLQNTPNRST